MDEPGAAEITQAVLRWFAIHGRSLPIRDLTDPYAIWICEAMSQQTQITRVTRSLPAFLERFPTLDSLAAAAPADVIRAWAGMGYNRRALDLRRAARAIVEQHDGRLPRDPASLAALPGIGPYTARAIAAFAFGVPVTALDVNAGRLLGRVLASHGQVGDPGRPMSAGVLQFAADALAPTERVADWNHALMDLGATICRPRPHCMPCPLRRSCSYAAGASADGTVRDVEPREHRAARRTDMGAARRRLRGRIVSALREASGRAWQMVDVPDGHTVDEVAEALLGLERDGLIERDTSGSARLAG